MEREREREREKDFTDLWEVREWLGWGEREKDLNNSRVRGMRMRLRWERAIGYLGI